VENKVFRKRESFWIIFQKTVLFIQNTEDLFRSWISSLRGQKKAFEKLSTDIKHATPDQLFFKRLFIKEL
jgi:transcription-repair coupling factor (superfamily II helicase)